jgi:hypothetical protein
MFPLPCTLAQSKRDCTSSSFTSSYKMVAINHYHDSGNILPRPCTLTHSKYGLYFSSTMLPSGAMMYFRSEPVSNFAPSGYFPTPATICRAEFRSPRPKLDNEAGSSRSIIAGTRRSVSVEFGLIFAPGWCRVRYRHGLDSDIRHMTSTYSSCGQKQTKKVMLAVTFGCVLTACMLRNPTVPCTSQVISHQNTLCNVIRMPSKTSRVMS